MDFTQNINEIFDHLKKFLCTETVIGNPLQVGNITLVPIINVSFGAGSGGGNGKDNKGNDSTGGGAGVGGKISPQAILVIKNDEVNVIPLTEKTSLDKIFAMVPDIMSKLNIDTSTEEKSNFSSDW